MRGGFDSSGVRFGDIVPVRLDVLVPRRLVDPASVRLETGFQPYRATGPLAPERVDDGGTTLLRYRFRLSCLEPQCVPDRESVGFIFSQGVVRYRELGGRPKELRVSWPVLRPESQLGPLDAGLLAWHADVRPPPEPDYRLPPRLLAAFLAALALACALISAGLLWPRIAAALPEPREIDRRSLLERALAAVRSAATADDAAERRRCARPAGKAAASRSPEGAGAGRPATRLVASRSPPRRDGAARGSGREERSVRRNGVSLVLGDAKELLTGARRTTVLRLALAAALATLLCIGLAVALRGEAGEPPLAEAGKTTILVLDVSSSIQPRVYRQVGDTVGRAIREGGRFGVVLFSDVAYELLPPGTPAAELIGLRRYFTPLEGAAPGVPAVAVGASRFPEAPWNQVFSGGTKISTGLRLARQLLEREGVANGKVVLVSDLEDEYLDVPELGRVLAGYADIELPLRVVALSPTGEDLRIFRRLLQDRGSVSEAALPRGRGDAEAGLPRVPFPALLVAVGVALALALALNEHLLARLPLRAEDGSR